MRRWACVVVVAVGLGGLVRAGVAGADATTAVYADPAHDGSVAGSTLAPPLRLLWYRDYGNPLASQYSGDVATVSWPLVANGRVFTVVWAAGGSALHAYSAADGHELWTRSLSGGGMAAYDAGRVFVVQGSGVMQAYDEATGATAWTTQLVGQYDFSAPPVASNGFVYTGGAGSGGTLYAVRESDGRIMWTQAVMNGNDSSPALDGSRVFVSYVGPQIYAFDRVSGAPVWHYSGCCEGGGGSTATVFGGRLFSRSDGALVLDATTGRLLDTFSGGQPPAFAGGHGVFVQANTIHAEDATTRAFQWSATGDGQSLGPPTIVNGRVYVGSSTRAVYALDLASGATEWCGALLPRPDSFDEGATPIVSAGGGVLVATVNGRIAAFGPGGTGSTCIAAPAPPAPPAPPPTAGTGTPPTPSGGTAGTGAAAAATLALRVRPRVATVGHKVRITATLSGMAGGVGGRTIRLEASPFPYRRWIAVARSRTAADGTGGFAGHPDRNTRLRVRLDGNTLTSRTVQLYADWPAAITRHGRLATVEVAIPRGVPGRRHVVHFYLGRSDRPTVRHVARRRLHIVNRSEVAASASMPHRLTRRDRVFACWRERKPDGYGKPSPVDPLCGRRTLTLPSGLR